MTYEPVGTEFRVNSTTSGDQAFPSVTYLGGGGFVVTWRDDNPDAGDSSGSSIKAQIYDSSGNPVGGELLINSTYPASQEDPAVTATANGGFVVTWVDSSGLGGDASGSSIKARLFNSDGTAIADEFLVNTATASVQIQPSITTLSDGRFAITWTDGSGEWA